MKHSILKKFAIGRERAQKERKTKTKTQKSKKVYRIKTLRDSDESTANLTSTASPTAAASSNESPSPRSSLHDESQASVVSELTWIDSEGSGNKRSSLTNAPIPRRQWDRKWFSEEVVPSQLPRASITSTISSKESLPRSSFSDSQSSMVSELTWLGSEGSSIRPSSLVSSKLSSSKQSPKKLLDTAMPQKPSNDDSQSSIVSDLTWLGSQRSIKPRGSSLAASIPEAPSREEDDGSRDKTSSDGSSKMGISKEKKKSKKKKRSNSKESISLSQGQTNATRRGFPSNPKSVPESPRLAHESSKASYRKRATGSSKAHGESPRSLSTSLHRGDSPKSSRPIASAAAWQVRQATKQTRRNSMASAVSPEPALSAWQVREATKHTRRKSMASAVSPKHAHPAWQLQQATKQTRRKSVTFADGTPSQDNVPPAFALIRDWSEGTLDRQPSLSKASAARLSPARSTDPRSTDDPKTRGVQTCPSIPKRSFEANIDLLLDRLDSSLHDEQRKDKAPVLPSQGRRPPERRETGHAVKNADSIQSTPPKQEKEKVKLKALETPRTLIGRRSEMRRTVESKNRRNSVNASMRNLMIDQTLPDMD
jgi:hypothetical protein